MKFKTSWRSKSRTSYVRITQRKPWNAEGKQKLVAAFLISADRREILITNSYIRIMLWLRHKNIKARNGDQCKSVVRSDLWPSRFCSAREDVLALRCAKFTRLSCGRERMSGNLV